MPRGQQMDHKSVFLVTESLPKAPPWHPKVMLMTLEAHCTSIGLNCRLML